MISGLLRKTIVDFLDSADYEGCDDGLAVVDQTLLEKLDLLADESGDTELLALVEQINLAELDEGCNEGFTVVEALGLENLEDWFNTNRG